jgi:hypothetical protein
MIVFGYLITFFWIIQFYFKKHEYIGTGIIGGIIVALGYLVFKGSWSGFIGLLMILITWRCVYLVPIVLDGLFRPSCRMRRKMMKQRVHEELLEYLQSKVNSVK